MSGVGLELGYQSREGQECGVGGLGKEIWAGPAMIVFLLAAVP